jgi:hypothetical protein
MRARRLCGHGVTVLLTIATTGGCLAASGCRSSGPPRPPGRLPAINVVIPDDRPWYFDRAADAPTRVVARCRGCEYFWKKTRGNWEYTWAVVRFDVLSVEHGSWPDATLAFVCWESWPTPESGIMINRPPSPYRKDATLVFDLDTMQNPARVVGQVVRYDPFRTPATRGATR